MKPAKAAAFHASRDAWTKAAFAAAVARAKDLVGVDGPVRPGEPVGKLGDDQWGWLVSTAVWGWLAIRAEQAATEGWDAERMVRTTGLEPDPWLAGAVAATLPKLAEACDFDWSQPVGAWAKDDIVAFLTAAFDLIREAVAARDTVEERIAGKVSADVVARELNAAAGNPLTAAELKELESCPF